jgi:uncharacterized protein (TIGR02611 family)
VLKKTIKLFKKAAVAIIGLTVLVVGLILLVLPGPGILVIIAGLFILSLEFEKAKRLNRQLKQKFDAAIKKTRSRDQPTEKN